MTFFERALIQVAEAFLAVWGFVKLFFGWVGSALEALLQPIMGPVLRLLNPLCTAIADAVYSVLSPFPPWLGLVLISALAGVVMLVAFRYLSNQAGIARAKDDIKANLLALKLFKDDLRVAMRAQFRIMWALLRLQRYILVPVLWMALPTMLLLSQMAMRYQWRPFVPGEQFLLKVHAAKFQGGAGVSSHSAIDVEIGPIAGADDVAWRLRARESGGHKLAIQFDSDLLEKEFVIGKPGERVSPVRPNYRWLTRLLYPIEPAFDVAESYSLDRIEVVYPSLPSRIYGSDYWVITFFVVSMLTAILLKPLFKVRF